MPKASKRQRDEADDKGEGYIELEPAGNEDEAPARVRSHHKASPSSKKATQQQQGDEQQPESRVVYIGNLPHGFYEKQLLGFFSQFGKLTHVRLSRNKKTGKAKHYAFLEFQYPEVAKIAADTMDGYFMFKQKLTCKVMEPERIHPLLFKGANQKFRNVPWRKLERQRHERERTPEEHARRISRLLKRDKQRQEKIKAAGIEYEYEGVQAKLPVKSKKIKLA